MASKLAHSYNEAYCSAFRCLRATATQRVNRSRSVPAFTAAGISNAQAKRYRRLQPAAGARHTPTAWAHGDEPALRLPALSAED
ncbi:hypothetical protein NDU88_006384 [Pleurodeles waltl]|uniref:Uncharacterized protein n=1 Tax=Pleurodeles waltl TaxID=8319 RepID=A0AAV7TWQ3_PLEWA|nr:hypothetical protein NDU88_006384 [Pleurodeles waltl]